MKIGSYETIGEVGRGGGGVVLRGRSVRDDDVAIKVVTSGSGPEALAEFDRERCLLEALGTSGFVPHIESGMASQRPYLVMPFLAGGTLRDRLRKGPLSVPPSVSLDPHGPVLVADDSV